MQLAEYWAYDFTSDVTMEAMRSLFNEAGPWQWEARESGWYGDYLSTRPEPGVRVRVHEYPFEGGAGTFIGLREKGFSVLLEIEKGSPAKQKTVDAAFRGLLARVNAAQVTEIEPYD